MQVRSLAVATRRGRVHRFTGRLTAAGLVPLAASVCCGRTTRRARLRAIADVDAALNGPCRLCARRPGKVTYLECADLGHLHDAIRFAPDNDTLDRLVVVLCDRDLVHKPLGFAPGRWAHLIARRREQLRASKAHIGRQPFTSEPRPDWWASGRTPAQRLRAHLASVGGET